MRYVIDLMPVFACGTFYVLTVKNYFSGLMVNCKLEMIQGCNTLKCVPVIVLK